MSTYKYKKSRFIINVIIICIIVIFSMFILMKFTHSYFLKYGMSGYLLMNGIYAINLINKDYKSEVLIKDNFLIITTHGKKHEIDFKNIISLDYFGIPHFVLWDNFVVDCGTKEKIGVECSYENYLNLWNQIIENTKQNNPKVVISPKLEKRLKKG